MPRARGIDEVIDRLRASWPELRCEQLRVTHPGADDDGVWFFAHPTTREEVQVESSSGDPPFLVESDQAPAAMCPSVEATLAVVARRLGLRDRTV